MAFSIVSVCANCHTQNRIPAQHLADHGRSTSSSDAAAT